MLSLIFTYSVRGPATTPPYLFSSLRSRKVGDLASCHPSVNNLPVLYMYYSGWLGCDFEGRKGKERARCPSTQCEDERRSRSERRRDTLGRAKRSRETQPSQTLREYRLFYFERNNHVEGELGIIELLGEIRERRSIFYAV